MTSPALAPWIERPFGLVSLTEILLMPRIFDDEGYPLDEIGLGRFFNLLYIAGALEQPPLTQTSIIQFQVMTELAAEDMKRYGFLVTARATRDLVEMLKGESVISNLPVQLALIRQTKRCPAASMNGTPDGFGVARSAATIR